MSLQSACHGKNFPGNFAERNAASSLPCKLYIHRIMKKFQMTDSVLDKNMYNIIILAFISGIFFFSKLPLQVSLHYLKFEGWCSGNAHKIIGPTTFEETITGHYVKLDRTQFGGLRQSVGQSNFFLQELKGNFRKKNC
jgi:hypothetical protein